MRTVAKKGWTRLWVLLCALFLVFSACGVRKSEADGNAPVMAVPEEVESTPEPSLAQLELLDPDYSESDSEIAGYDFKNHTYPLPRGWQNADGTDLELTDGFRRTTEDKIGMADKDKITEQGNNSDSTDPESK